MFSSGKRVQKYNLFLNYQNIFSKKIINKYLHIEKQHIENQKKNSHNPNNPLQDGYIHSPKWEKITLSEARNPSK